MLASASLGEDAALLDLLVEATQGAFERLVLTHSDFSQSVFTSPGLESCRAHRARGQPASTRAHTGTARAAGVYPSPARGVKRPDWQSGRSGRSSGHLAELLAEREGLVVAERTLRRVLAETELATARSDRSS